LAKLSARIFSRFGSMLMNAATVNLECASLARLVIAASPRLVVGENSPRVTPTCAEYHSGLQQHAVSLYHSEPRQGWQMDPDGCM
jgi:hypothetical protein